MLRTRKAKLFLTFTLTLVQVMLEPSWEPTAVGYIRPAPPVIGYQNPAGSFLYNCPVYLTTFRGATYVCLSTLKTRERPEKWTLAGVALVMQSNGGVHRRLADTQVERTCAALKLAHCPRRGDHRFVGRRRSCEARWAPPRVYPCQDPAS